jgi:hypothetical protein
VPAAVGAAVAAGSNGGNGAEALGPDGDGRHRSALESLVDEGLLDARRSSADVLSRVAE